jgi:CCR4-NOT transcription complex subunit 1
VPLTCHDFPLPHSLPAGTSLIQVLVHLGQEITSDVDNVRALLARFGISDANPPRDSQVIEVMSTLARLALEGATLCDVGALVRALSSFVHLTRLLSLIVIVDENF